MESFAPMKTNPAYRQLQATGPVRRQGGNVGGNRSSRDMVTNFVAGLSIMRPGSLIDLEGDSRYSPPPCGNEGMSIGGWPGI